MDRPLEGKRIAVFVENKFIPEEIEAYRSGFGLLGADVRCVSRTWYGDYRPGHAAWSTPVFYSDVDPIDDEPWQSPARLVVDDGDDVSTLDLGELDAVVMAANYTSVRLRWEELAPGGAGVDLRAYVQSPPVVQFFAAAMRDPSVVKGALCHGLWILTPFPELLAGRRVTCHTVVMADVLNCGAEVQVEMSSTGSPQVAPVVCDGDLVTAYSKHEVLPFIARIAEEIERRAGTEE